MRQREDVKAYLARMTDAQRAGYLVAFGRGMKTRHVERIAYCRVVLGLPMRPNDRRAGSALATRVNVARQRLGERAST
jgi:hypothetical protein